MMIGLCFHSVGRGLADIQFILFGRLILFKTFNKTATFFIYNLATFTFIYKRWNGCGDGYVADVLGFHLNAYTGVCLILFCRLFLIFFIS